jgi:hypothetical protein
MPGRHSGSSNLGGSFSGGGNWGGGNWGGGWRPRGPWNPGPYYGGGGSGFGWLLLGLLPWLFGPRFGRGGGFGCGGFGCFIFLCLFLVCVVSGGLGSLRGLGGNYYDGDGPVYNPYYGGGTGLSSEPPQVQTQTALDLRELHEALDSKIAQWQNQLATDEYHSISGAEAGLTKDNNTKEVIYGKCGQALYVFVVLRTRPDTGPADGEGYAYTTANSPGSCRPPAYAVYDSEDVGGGWWFVTLKSQPDANLGR